MKILYIAGSSRCGSTLLANILGELPGFLSVGELRFLWDRAREGRLCGCGETIAECELWSQVLRHTDAASPEHLDEIRGWQADTVRLHRTPGLVAGRTRTSLVRYVDVLTRTIDAVGRVTGSQVLVDSSKHPAQAAALLRVPGVDLYLLHLIRDPRAVAYSQRRWKPNPDGVRTGGMGGASVWWSVTHWSASNVASSLVRWRVGAPRSMLLRYEDLVDEPAGRVRTILEWIGEARELSPAPFLDERSISLGRNHTVSGNPDRFTRGLVEVKPDDRWVREMSTPDRRITSALTAPLRPLFGYGTRPKTGW